MEWVTALAGQVIGLDTAPIIYLIEEHPVYLPFVTPFFEALDRGEVRAVTSVITLTEVLVHPLRNGDASLAQRYREILLQAANLVTAPTTEAIAEGAAELRAAQTFRTPDALQLATAMHHGASAFLTNDARLRTTPGVRVILLDDLIGTP